MSQSQLVAYGVCVTYRADSILSWRKGKQGRLGILSACACVFFLFLVLVTAVVAGHVCCAIVCVWLCIHSAGTWITCFVCDGTTTTAAMEQCFND